MGDSIFRGDGWIPADAGALDCDGDPSFWKIFAFALLDAVEVGCGLFNP